jgi:phage gpG-like protein
VVVIETRVELEAVYTAFRGLLATAKDHRAAFRDAVKPLRADQRAHAKAKMGPDASWPSRSPLSRAKSGAKARTRRRRLLGRLPTALMSKVSPTSLQLISRAKWSAVHMTGGRVGHGAKLPARPFLWASDAVLETIAKIFARRFEVRWPR